MTRTGDIRDKAEKVAEKVKETGEEIGSRLAGGMEAAGEAVEQLREDGARLTHDLAGNVGQKIDDAARSLRNLDGESMVRDVESFVRERPLISIGLAAVAGYFVTRLCDGLTGKTVPRSRDS